MELHDTSQGGRASREELTTSLNARQAMKLSALDCLPLVWTCRWLFPRRAASLTAPTSLHIFAFSGRGGCEKMELRDTSQGGRASREEPTTSPNALQAMTQPERDRLPRVWACR